MSAPESVPETDLPSGDEPPAGLEAPRGTVSIRTVAMPADTNPSGDIFGGWLMAQMDLAGGTHAMKIAAGRVATVAVTGFTFHLPVHVGDELTCYTRLLKLGRTSLTIDVAAWVCRRYGNETLKVTEGVFVFVALDEQGRSRALPASAARHLESAPA